MKLRPIIFIVLTLFIGIFLGMLLSAQLRHKRMNPVRIYSSEQRFREDAIHFLQPDEVQLVLLEPIIKKYAKENNDMQKEYRRNFEQLMQNYSAEIKPLLTAEQLDRISSMQNRRRVATKRFRPDSLDNERRHPGDSSFEHGRRDGSRSPQPGMGGTPAEKPGTDSSRYGGSRYR
ncbi:MAG: hypothetical protein E4G95_06510 [Bacteroidia bacterium]|nr:MAG: hypothetical protein E4G95_06510 [Bacteroidia bacterium]